MPVMPTESLGMHPTDETDGLTELESEALDLVQRMTSGSVTEETLDAARRWQTQSPAHAEAIAFARSLWSRLGPAGEGFLAQDRRALGADWLSSRIRPSRRALLAGASAVAVAGYVALRPPFELWPSLSELTADYRTTTGEHRQITLKGGLSIELNTQTSIRTQSAAQQTAVLRLISGEAIISAAGGQRSEHLVRAGDGEISFGEASLSVRFDGHAFCLITCLQGAVRVERMGMAVELGPDQHVAYEDRGLGASAPADSNIATAWQRGLLIFRQAPLSDVVAEINRYRRGKIVLLSSALGRRTVNARFTIDDVDSIMVLARREFGARVTALPGGVVLLS